MATVEYYAANREARLAYQKARYRAKKDDLVAYQRAYRMRSDVRSRSGERSRQWKRDNPDLVRASERRRRARKQGCAIEVVDLVEVLRRSRGLCGLCGKPLKLFDTQFDHIVPLARGGVHSTDNLQAAHALCNQRKGTKLPEECVSWQ